jgi:hypothetical protein
MKKPAGIFLIITGILMLTSCSGAPQQGKDRPLSRVQTDNYTAAINAQGSLTFTDKDGNAILDSSPQFYFDYGDRSVSDLPLTNPSFEADSNSDGIPDGWTVDKAYIRQSDKHASDRNNALKFSMAAADSKPRSSYSPFIEINKNSSYSIKLDAYVESFTSGTAYINTYGYPSADGSGSYNSSLGTRVPTTNTGAWNTISWDWTPPYDARSFKVCLYSENSTVATIYFDNLKVSQVTKNYQSNGADIVTNVVTFGNDVTITATDDTNASVTVAHKYELNTRSPDIRYTARLTYKKDVIVNEERFDFVVPTSTGLIMTRDLQFAEFNKVKREYYSDLYSPRVVKFRNGLSFPGDDTMQSMRLRATGTTSTCSFYSDNQFNHPFKYYVKDGGGNMTDLSAQSRRIGDSYSASVSFSISPGILPGSLVKTRQPDGYEAVLVLANFAGSERTATVNAVAYGTEDAASPDYGTKGIVGRGIGWTKSVFVAWQYTPYGDLNDPGFKALHDRMARDGAEITGNTISADTDTRAEVAAGLQRLTQYGAVNWMDADAASGANNLEDIASQGTIKGNINYTLDLLDARGYEYAWSYIDMATTGYDLNMLNPAVVGANTSFFYYNNRIDGDPTDGARIYLWSTLNTKKRPDLYYTGDNIDKLISQRGVHIGREYMAAPASENRTWYAIPAGGKIEVMPAFDSQLAYIASKRDAGLLWTPTMAQFAGYLKLQQNVRISNIGGGDYRVTNNNAGPIKGLTLLAEKEAGSVSLDAKELSLAGGSYAGNKIVLPELSPGQTVLLSIGYRTLP